MCDSDESSDLSEQMAERLAHVEGLILSPGAPRIEAATMDSASDLKIIGEMEGDRFADRIDVEAAWERASAQSTLPTQLPTRCPTGPWP